MSTPVTCQCAPLWSQGTPMGHMSTPPVYSENSADFNFPLYGEKIEMDLAVDLGCRAEERHTTNNYDNNGHTHLLDSNRQHCCYVPRTNHHINTARRRRRRIRQSQIRALRRLRMRPGRQKRICRTHVYWRGNSPDLSAVPPLPVPLESCTLPRCSPQAAQADPPISRCVR
jgi:hypothetical protein